MKWLFFDVGYTLVNEDEMWRHRVDETRLLAQAIGRSVTNDAIYQRISELFAAYMPVAPNVARELGLADMAPYRGEYEELYSDAAATLASLKQRYKLGIIANQPENLDGRLQKLGILQYFDLVVSSHDVGMVKPSEKIFTFALDKAGCLPQDAVMVGDRLDNDIAPAKALGFTTVRVKQGLAAVQQPRDEFSVPDYTVERLCELTSIF